MTATETASGGSPASLAASVEATATLASARQAEEGASPQPSSAPDYDERAVRLAAGWGAANLRLARIRDVLDQCCPEDRARILGAIEGQGL